MSTVNVNRVVDANGGVLAPISSVMRNRIINGAMVIDQRNAGASVTNINGTVYSVDRWAVTGYQASKFTAQQNAGAVTPPAGFTNYLGCTSSSAYSVGSGEYFVARQAIEGFNMADLNWGTANAKTITLSFWVRSSLTGTFGGSISNNAVNRSYPFTYTINSANTWEYETITIAGDTSGTWLTTNGIGMYVYFNLGSGSTFSGTAGTWAASQFTSATGATSVVGTNGATFYVTGVQLEVGTQATSFEYRQYQQELALCQRYYQTGIFSMSGYFGAVGSVGYSMQAPVVMRTTPTVVFTDTLNTNTNAGTSQANLGPTASSVAGEAVVSGAGGFRFARTYTSSAEL